MPTGVARLILRPPSKSSESVNIMQSTVHTEEEPVLSMREELDSMYPIFLVIPDQDERASALNTIGTMYYMLYNMSERMEDLEKAISVHEEAVQLTSATHPRLAKHLYTLGAILQHRFIHESNTRDIERAIQLHENALSLIDDANPDKPNLLWNLGTILQTRFRQTGNPTDIENAILSKQKAVDLTLDGDPERPARLSSLGTALLIRFEILENHSDIDNAIISNQKAVDLTQDDHPDKPGYLFQTGDAFRMRFERLGDFTDVENAILYYQKAADLTPDNHPHKPGCLSHLGCMLQTRFDKLERLADIENAILCHQKASDLTPDGNLDKPGYSSNLGNALELRFKWLGTRPDIDNSILCKQKAVDLTTDDHPDKPAYLSNLGNALETRFNRFGNLTDLGNAILSNQKAVNLAPDDHPERPARLSNLGNVLQTRFDRLGRLADIENAILCYRKAVDLTPDIHRYKPGYLSNLGATLRKRFYQLGSLTDLENAIIYHRKAVDLSPDDRPEKPGLLSNLGNALQIRFDNLGVFRDIENATLCNQKAVDLTPEDHPDKPKRFSNLGNALEARFKHSGNPLDIENSILSNQKAVDLTSDGHPDKPAYLSNLGRALEARFNLLGSLKDLNDAILSIQEAVDLTPDGHPSRSVRLSYLGKALLSRLERLNNIEDLGSMLHAYSQAAKSPIGSPIVRFHAACAWAKQSEKYTLPCLPAYGCAIDLLPRVAWLGLPITDQHALLADIGSIVRHAVSAAIRSEELETAVEWAEQGRAIVWQNLLGLRTPVDDLRAKYPRLADKIQAMARLMEASTSHDVADANIRSSQLAIDWENTVKEIRRLPGFEGFMKAKTFSQLAPVAHEGPVVILNVDDTRSDALVLIADDSKDKHVSVINIPLTRFSCETGRKLCEKLADLLKSSGLRARGETRRTGRVFPGGGVESTFQKILRILWLDVVKPFIDGLAYQTQPEHLTRIWWCVTGSLSFLPIHAAGIYGIETGDKLPDYVVSSYTPTLTAILDSSTSKVEDNFTILTVAQPSTPNAAPILKTEDEVKVVQSLASGMNVVSLVSEEGTVDRVLQAMKDTDWIHMACHGKQETSDPMKSGLLLHDKILELSEIVRHALPRADFAFLSACQTAVGDERIPDESAHLAAGMFMAGYRGVIATMWSIKDKDAPQVAEDVYKQILKNGKPNRKEAAHALHDAVKRLRDSGAGFMAWVPFIHLGR